MFKLPDFRNFNTRLNCVAIILLLALGAILVRTAMLSLQGGTPERSRLERRVHLPALRGRILTADGVLLTYSRRYYWLLTNLPPDKSHTLDEKGALLAAVPRCVFDNGPQLADDLSPEELLRLRPLIREGMPVSIVNEESRIISGLADGCLEALGTTAVAPDFELSGKSGWEKQYDQTLRGTPGEAVVLVNRYGWVKGSFRIIRKPVPGQDVKLPYTWREINEGKK